MLDVVKQLDVHTGRSVVAVTRLSPLPVLRA
jgi:hypothetical protein